MIVKKLELPEGAITGSLEEADTELTLNINGVVYLLVDHVRCIGYPPLFAYADILYDREHTA